MLLIINYNAGTWFMLLCLYLHTFSVIWMVLMLILSVQCLGRIQWWQGTRGETTHLLLLACYHSTLCDACVHCLHATREYLMKFLEQLHSHTYANVKFQLSCTTVNYVLEVKLTLILDIQFNYYSLHH